MSLTLSNDSKNTLAITNESKPVVSGTFGSDAGRTFADGGTFANQDFYIAKETKNTLTIANESKSSDLSVTPETKNTISISNESKL